MIEHLVLPPEASTNWLFDESAMTRLCMAPYQKVVMDRADYERYRRLAPHSDLDFLKCFALTILYRCKKLLLPSYRKLYSPGDVWESMRGIAESGLVRETQRFEALIEQAYWGYLNYIANKNVVLDYMDEEDKQRFRGEQGAAHSDLAHLGTDDFGVERCAGYLTRLASKLLAAAHVARHFRSAVVFDGPEYKAGMSIIDNEGLRTGQGIVCPTATSDPLVQAIKPVVHKKGLLSENALMFAPLALLQSLKQFHVDSHLTGRLRAELAVSSTYRELDAQVDACLAERRYVLAQWRSAEAVGRILTAAAGIASTFASVLSTIAELLCLVPERRKISGGFLVLPQLIASALETQGYFRVKTRRTTSWWLHWFRRTFDPRTQYDCDWQQTQRSMQEWTDRDVYVPWYELVFPAHA